MVLFNAILTESEAYFECTHLILFSFLHLFLKLLISSTSSIGSDSSKMLRAVFPPDSFAADLSLGLAGGTDNKD